MHSLMYGLSVKPQYENWCNCSAVRLFSPWVTPGPSLYFFCFVTHLSTTILSVYLLSLSPPILSLSLSPARLCVPFLSSSVLDSPVLHSLYNLQPQRPDFLPLERREGLLSATSSSHMATWEWLTCRPRYPPSPTCELCAWNELHVGGRTEIVCASMYLRERTFVYKSVFIWIM